MFPNRRIVRFVVAFLLLYGLLVAPWPGLKQVYAVYFRAGGNVLFESFGSRGSVRLIPANPQHDKWDTEAHLIHRGQPTYWRVGFHSRRTGYLPTATLIALILATPIRLSRRGRALLWGIILVNGFVALRVAIAILREFPNVDLFVFSPFWGRVIEVTHDVVSVSTVTSCVVPALIWLLVTFRHEDWGAILRISGASRTTP